MNQGRNDYGRGPKSSGPVTEKLSQELLQKLQFEKPAVDLFDSTAEQFAKCLAESKPEHNKSSQIRRFYDEVCTWEARLRISPEKFDEFLPLIRMLNAKVAYAKGRRLLDDNFVDMMRTGLQRVNSKDSFFNFKLFLEAVIGFHKLYKKENAK